MIDPGLLGSVGPIVLGTAVGLVARRIINRHDDDIPPSAAADRLREGPTPSPRPRPVVRPAVPAGRR